LENIMRIGIFGGTFDPPHLGHLILAAEAFHQLALDRLLWVLTPDPPHKHGQLLAPLSQRLEMLRFSLADAPDFELSTVDIDRPGPHYAVDTVRAIQRAQPQAAIIYLMGGDSLRDLMHWHTPAEFVAACHKLGVMRRPGDQIDVSTVEKALPGVMEKVHFVDAPLLEIASHEIRERIAQGRPFQYYLHPAVYAIIRQQCLYK